MAQINLSGGFNVTTKDPIDFRLVKTKAEMLNMTAAQKLRMPDIYFCLCKDDKQIYVYDKNNEKDPETGYFRPFNYLTSDQVNELINNEATRAKGVEEALNTKIDALDNSLATLARTGMAHDLLQEENEYLTLNCNFE